MNQPARRSLTVVTVMLLASFSAAMSPIVAAENSETLEDPHSSDAYVIFEASQHSHWSGSELHFETHFGNDGEINDQDGNVWMNYAITQDIDDDGNQDYLAFMWSHTTPLDWYNVTFNKHDWYQTYVGNLESANPVTIQGEWGSWECIDNEYTLDGTYKYTEEDCHEDDGENAGPYGSWEPYTEESFSFEYTLDAFVTVDIDSASQEVTLEVQQDSSDSSTYQIDWDAWTNNLYSQNMRDDFTGGNYWNDNGNTESGVAVINTTTDGDYHVCYRLNNVTSIAQKDELSSHCGDVHIGPDVLHVALDFSSTRLNLHVDARADDDFSDYNIMIECDVTDPDGVLVQPHSSGGSLNLGGWYATDWNETGTPIWWEFSHETHRHHHNVLDYPDVAGHWRVDCDLIDSQTPDRNNDTVLLSANETENITAYGSLGQLHESTFDEDTSELTAPLRMYATDSVNPITATAQIGATPFSGANLDEDCNSYGWDLDRSEMWTTTSSSNTTMSADLSNFTAAGDALYLAYAVSPGTNSVWHVYTDQPVVYSTLCSADGGVDVYFQRFYSNITNTWFGGQPLWNGEDPLNMTIEVDILSNGTLIMSEVIGGEVTDYQDWADGEDFWCDDGNGSVVSESVNDGIEDCDDGSDEGWYAYDTGASYEHQHFLEGLGTGLYTIKTRVVDFDPAGNTTLSETETGPIMIRGNLEYEDLDWIYDTEESVEPRLYTTGITESEDDWTIAWELWDSDDINKDKIDFDQFYECIWEGGEYGEDSTEDSLWYCKGGPDWGGYHDQRSYCEEDADDDRWYCTHELQGDGSEYDSEVHLEWMPGVSPKYDGEAPSHTWQFQFDLDDGSYRMCAGLYLSDELHSPDPYWLEDDFTHQEWTYDDEGNWGYYETDFRAGYDEQRHCRDFHVGPPDVQVELWCLDCPDANYRVEMSYGDWDSHYYLEYNITADGEELLTKDISGNFDHIHHYGTFNIPATAMQIEMDFTLYEHPATMDCADGSGTIDIWQTNDGMDDCADGSDEGYDYTDGALTLVQEGTYTWDLPPRFIVEGGIFSDLESVIVDAGYIGYDATKVTGASLDWNLRGPDHYSSGEVTKMFETFDHGILESGQWNFCVYGQIELDDGHMMEDHQCSQILVSVPFSQMSHNYNGYEHEIYGQFTLFGTFDGEDKESDFEDSDEGMPEYPEYNLTLRISDDTNQILTYQQTWLGHDEGTYPEWMSYDEESFSYEPMCNVYNNQWHSSNMRLIQFNIHCQLGELFPGDYNVVAMLDNQTEGNPNPMMTDSVAFTVHGWLKIADIDDGYQVRYDLGEEASIDFDASGLDPGMIDWNLYTFDDGRDIWSLMHDDEDEVLSYNRIVHWGETSSVDADTITWDASSSAGTIEVTPPGEGIYFLCAEWDDGDGNYTRTEQCAPIFVGDIPVDVYAYNGLDWNTGSGSLIVGFAVLFPQDEPDHLVLSIEKDGVVVYDEQFNCTVESTEGWWEDEYNETTDETTQVWVEESWTEEHCQEDIREDIEFADSQLSGPGEYDIEISLYDENSVELASDNTVAEYTGLFGDIDQISMRCGDEDWWSDGDHIECGLDASPTVEIQYEIVSTNESVHDFELQGIITDDSGNHVHSESLSVGQLIDEHSNEQEWDVFEHCEWRGDDETVAWVCQWQTGLAAGDYDEERPYCEYDDSEGQWYCNYMVDWDEASEDDQYNTQHLGSPFSMVIYQGSTTITIEEIGHYNLNLNLITDSGLMQASRHAKLDVRYFGPVVISGPLFGHFDSGESASFFFAIEGGHDDQDGENGRDDAPCEHDFSTPDGIAGGAGTASGGSYTFQCTDGFGPSGPATCTDGAWNSPTCDADNDADGTGDNADSDDDKDGTQDTADAFPFDVYYEVSDDTGTSVAQGTISSEDMVSFQTSWGDDIIGGNGEIGVLPDGDYELDAWLVEDGVLIEESSVLADSNADGDVWPFAAFTVGGEDPELSVSTTFDGQGGVVASVTSTGEIESVMVMKLSFEDDGDEPTMIDLDENGLGEATLSIGMGGLMVILVLNPDTFTEESWGTFAFKFMFIHPEYIDDDLDGDGLTGTDDMCPGLAGPLSQYGCPLIDADEDGVWDHEDDCPGTAGGANVDLNGCEAAQADDSDQDGIPDDQDACPFASGTLSDGCPDQDGDGVVGDECPTEAGPLSNAGCPVQSDDDNRLPACDVFVTRIDGVDASSQNKRGTATSNMTIPVSIQAGNVTIKIHCMDPDGDAVAVTITDLVTNQNFAFPPATVPVEQTVALFQTTEPVVFKVEWSDGTAFGNFNIEITVQADPNAEDSDAAGSGGPVGGFVPGVGLFTSLMLLGMVATLIRPRDARRLEE